MTEYHKRNIANVNIGDLKSAAMFFDHVIPLSARGIHVQTYPESHTKESFYQLLDDLLPGDLKSGGIYHSVYQKVLRENEELRRTRKHWFKEGMYEDEAIIAEGVDFRIPFKEACQSLFSVSKSYRDSIQIEFDSENTNYLQGDDIFISLINMHMVDVGRTSWDQIIEFRKDKENLNKYRKLRLFLFKNYQGKGMNYIQDDILQKIEDYNDCISKWKFKTKLTIFDTILSSKSLYSSSTATILSTLFQNPSLTALLGGSGVLIELGKISLKFFKAKRERIELNENSPIAYLLTAQKSFPLLKEA